MVTIGLGLQQPYWLAQEVAEFACTCERYVGTQSGGMDQAIAMMGMPGVAQLINFDPVCCGALDS